MPFGHSILDYFVVVGIALWTIKLLVQAPKKLLLWLPLFLTIDFFIPWGTQLTPSRVVPLLIGAWLLIKGWDRAMYRHFVLVGLTVLCLLISFLYSLSIGDAGIRPFFRLLHYLSLIFVFLFVVRFTSKGAVFEYAIWGLLLAGLVHGGYALYQQFAAYVGLPFRGIVYGDSGDSPAVYAGPFLRVNGFADEPKRLGYVLVCAACAAFYFAFGWGRFGKRFPLGRWSRIVRSKQSFAILTIALIIAALSTFSGSLFVAVLLTLATFLLLLSKRVFVILAPVSIVAALVALSLPSITSTFLGVITDLSEERAEEIAVGLDARFVYRQELYAQALVEDEPMTIIQGVGIGRYNTVLNERFGFGAGFNEYGGIKPLNSQLYEVGFDLGLIGLLILYLGGVLCAIKVGQRTTVEFVLSSMLVFLLYQSLFIENKLYIAFGAATCLGFLYQRRALVVGERGRFFLK